MHFAALLGVGLLVLCGCGAGRGSGELERPQRDSPELLTQETDPGEPPWPSTTGDLPAETGSPAEHVPPTSVEEALGPERLVPEAERWVPALSSGGTCERTDHSSRTEPWALRVQYWFDQQGRPVRLNQANDPAAHASSERRRFDRTGHLVSNQVRIIESAAGPSVTRVTYAYQTDASRSVTRTPTCDPAGCVEPVETFSYDGQGRVSEIGEGELVTHCHYESDRLSSITSERSECTRHFSYDENGSLLGEVRTCEGMLESVRVARRVGPSRVEWVEFRDNQESGEVAFLEGNCGTVLFHPCGPTSSAPPAPPEDGIRDRP